MNKTTENPYESKKLLEEYLLLHYGRPEEVLPWEFGPHSALNFPVRVVEEFLSDLNPSANDKALDLGCAVGRSSFELSKYYGSVLGIDYSSSFINAATKLQKGNKINFQYLVEGSQSKKTSVKLPPNCKTENISFQTGDACNLPSDLEGFKLVVLANLICRLPQPASLLDRLPSLVTSSGHALITSPYTWTEKHTPKENWLNNFKEGGFEEDSLRSLPALKEILSPKFKLLQAKDLPFLIREHSRKFQWSVAQASLWERVE